MTRATIARAGIDAVRAALVAGFMGATALASGAAAQDDTVVIARDTDFNMLDPSRSWCDTCQIYLTAAYDQLVRVGDDNETIEPRLATDWTISDDGLTYTIKLTPTRCSATARRWRPGTWPSV
ncbi:hypothetical protein [Acuticoccus sp.]|uniref:hypothetical protein n=1 Tax=Acuticoccus sp. TaxID=1904378 RepID=UPI003B521799